MAAKRRLTDISFEHDGAHVALVGKFQGGPANGVTTLVLKATDDISEEALEKAMSSQEGESNVETPSIENNEELMKEEIQKAVSAAEEVLKAQHKQEMEAKEVELQKALSQLAEIEKNQKEAITKARKEKLERVVSKEEAEELFKSLEPLAEEAFEAVFKSLEKKAQVEQESDLFKEKGVSGEGNAPKQEEAGLALVGELIKKSKKQ